MKKLMILFLIAILYSGKTSAFCGFYVAKADAKLFNKTSQVILVRNGEKTVLTMSSDFQGDVKEFAMVVPVPVVLKEQDVRVTDRRIFEQLDSYSGPRLVEYHDQLPCNEYDMVLQKSMNAMPTSVREESNESFKDAKYKVQVVAKYTVGEYDIMILSAEESGGLENWLKDNGYKIPENAKSVLEPYIKNDMKFFVVKVNLEEQKKLNLETLRPIQISFQSKKFMLPIRLGMANGNGNQDMIVYAFTKNGRVETSNYRTVRMPTDKNIPQFVQQYFSKFYVDLYKRTLKKEGMDNVFLEYAWNLSGENFTKCDPCAGPPPMPAEFTQAGIDWLQFNNGGYSGSVFFTRLHVTYNRNDFPQDLVFHETMDRENFQCRYVINHPARNYNNCKGWDDYVTEKKAKRRMELKELHALTGWDVSIYSGYPGNFYNYDAPEPEMFTGSVKVDKPKSQSLIDSSIANISSINSTDNHPKEEISQSEFLPENSVVNDKITAGTETTKWAGSAGIIILVMLAGFAAMHKRSS